MRDFVDSANRALAPSHSPATRAAARSDRLGAKAAHSVSTVKDALAGLSVRLGALAAGAGAGAGP